MPTAEEPKQNVRGISVGIFYVLKYLMESRKEMTIPVSNDIIFYKESDKSERIKEKVVKKKKIMVALAVKDIDTAIMGWNTYHQIVTELSPDEWVYKDFIIYVVTHKPKRSSENIHFTNECPVELVKKLREGSGKDI